MAAGNAAHLVSVLHFWHSGGKGCPINAYEADHYDPEKAAVGVKSNHIDAEYDWIQDYDTEPMLMQDDLKIKLPDQQWSPIGSGIEIKSSILPELKKMWLEQLEYISNTAGEMLFKGVFSMLMVAAGILGSAFLVWTGVEQYKKIWDDLYKMVWIASVSFIAVLGNVIREFIPVNLIIIFFLINIGFVFLRKYLEKKYFENG